MKNRRKHSQCLNCGQNLHQSHNYCANCGQENTDNEVSLTLLTKEFTSNFFSLDSRFGRTLFPFIFKPGHITKAFNEGKRIFYANPIRWYLVISLIHFFLLTKYLSPENQKGDAVIMTQSTSLTKAQADSIQKALPLIESDTGDWPIPDDYFPVIKYYIDEEEMTVSQVMTQLKFDELSWTRRNTIRQMIKISMQTQASLGSYFLKQIPLMVFFIVPIFGFMLKLFYWKRGRSIHHIVHSLHLHSFLLFIYSIAWILALINDALLAASTSIAGIITVLYFSISFKKVYQSRWRYILPKSFALVMLYTIACGIAFVVGLLISFFLF